MTEPSIGGSESLYGRRGRRQGKGDNSLVSTVPFSVVSALFLCRTLTRMVCNLWCTSSSSFQTRTLTLILTARPHPVLAASYSTTTTQPASTPPHCSSAACTPLHWASVCVIRDLTNILACSAVTCGHFRCPRGLTLTWWGCHGLCQRHKLTELAHSFFFYSVLVSVSVFMALSTVFRSINSSDNSPFSHSVLPVLFLPYWSFQLMHLLMSLLQHRYNPLRLTGLKTPTN